MSFLLSLKRRRKIRKAKLLPICKAVQEEEPLFREDRRSDHNYQTRPNILRECSEDRSPEKVL